MILKTCVVMVVFMTTGEPANDCVDPRACKQLQRLVDRGLKITVPVGTEKHRHFRHVKKVTCKGEAK